MLKLEFMMCSSLLLTFMFNNLFLTYSAILIMLTMIMSMILINSQSFIMISSFLSTDIMSSSLTILTIWITAMMMLASMKIKSINNKPNMFIITTSILLVILMNCFLAPNLFMFYILFEASLIPTMILIMVWGYQQERSQASMYLMIYTVVASLPMLMAICKIFLTSKTSMMPMFMLMKYPSDFCIPHIAWIMTIMGFMVKLPMFTTHLWLPKAHVEAPVAGSMILAAILLKLGGYGILRMLSLFQLMSKSMYFIILGISMTGAVITSMICLRQSDLKSLIAYSSVGHMGMMVTGASTSSSWGFQAALLMMVAHGLSSSALFVMANINYEIMKTRSLFLAKGIMLTIPTLTLWWFMFTATNMAAPPSINLLSEIMLISSIMSTSFMAIILLAMTSFFTVAYSLYMYSSVNHGMTTMYSNPMITMKSKDITLMFMHIIPSVIILMKPELATMWM